MRVWLAARALLVDGVHAPPETVLKHALHLHMPTDCLFSEFFPQKEQVYLMRCATSYFLDIFLREPPYLAPYLPVIPAFLVLFDIAS